MTARRTKLQTYFDSKHFKIKMSLFFKNNIKPTCQRKLEEVCPDVDNCVQCTCIQVRRNGQFREPSYLQSRAAVRRKRQRERRWLNSTRSVYETPHLVLYFKATAKEKQAFLRFALNFAAGDNIWLCLPTADGNIGQKIVIKSLEAILPVTVSREQRKNLRRQTKYLQRLQRKYLQRSIRRCSVWVHSGTQQKTLSAILFIHAMDLVDHWFLETFCVRMLCFSIVFSISFLLQMQMLADPVQPTWFKPGVNGAEAVA